MYQQLHIEFDQDGEDECCAVLCTATDNRVGAHRAFLPNRKQFTLTDIRQAALSSKWVIEQDGMLLLDSLISCTTLADFLGRMFDDYFDGPGLACPTTALLRIRDQVQAYVEQPIELPLFAYACLDMVIRDDVADDARSADLWSSHNCVQIDLQQHRDRRIHELLDRYRGGQQARQRHPSNQNLQKRTPSIRSRSTGESKVG